RNIILLRVIGTIIEFKQIVGRGTRPFEGKDYFTIYDFVKAYEHFNDPEWDGEPQEPVRVTSRGPREPAGDYNVDPPTDDLDSDSPTPRRPPKIVIKLAYIAYANTPISRCERVLAHKGLIFSRYTGTQQDFLDFVLDQYIRQGVGELDQDKLPQLLELKYHDIRDAVANLGSVNNIRTVFIGFQQHLYSDDRVA
ncbi:MAG: restriction endonuclease subunit R, partial [Leptolyngbya sp. LCM1.Bin17]